jgi:hypothetical protein
MAIGPAIGATGSYFGAKESAGATTAAANTAAAEQQAALQQQATLSAPYRSLGTSAIPTLESLLGIGGKDPTAALRATPGYQFQEKQGTQNAVNQATAMGMGLSGNTLESLSKFNQGLADTTFQQAVGNELSAVGIGQAAAAGQAANIGNAASNLGNIAVNQGNNIAGINANLAAALSNSGQQFLNNSNNTLGTIMGLSGGGGGGGGLFGGGGGGMDLASLFGGG